MVDVTKQDQIDAALVHIKKTLVDTNAVLWGLVNNAGILPLGFVEACPMENYRKCMEINTFGAVATCKTFLPLIRESEGRIVNVCSVAGRIGVGTWSAYSMSKFALEAFTDCLRREMELWHVKVITIEPGYFKTDLTKPERFRQLMKDNWDKSPACVRTRGGQPRAVFWIDLPTLASSLKLRLYHNLVIDLDGVCDAALLPSPRTTRVLYCSLTVNVQSTVLSRKIGLFCVTLSISILMGAGVVLYCAISRSGTIMAKNCLKELQQHPAKQPRCWAHLSLNSSRMPSCKL